MKSPFFGKKLLILGGSSTVGIAVAEAAIKNGLCPTLTYRSPKGQERIEQTLKPYSGQYHKFLLYLKGGKVQGQNEKYLEERFDYGIDLIHSEYEALISSADEGAVQEYYLNMVVARQSLLKQLTRQMLGQKKGRLIYLSSTAAAVPNPGQGFYCSSKQAVESLYHNIGIELGRKGITTAVLRAGYMNAGRGYAYLEQHSDLLKKIPTRQPLTAREVAETLLFLLSDSALNINATAITMDGGMTACK